MRLLIILFFPLWVYSQGTFKISSGTNIISTNNPTVNLYNTNLYNNTGISDFSSGTIWGFTGNVPQNINGTNITNFHGLRSVSYTHLTLPTID
jgi:hypothetical protein